MHELLDEFLVSRFTLMGPTPSNDIGIDFIYENGTSSAVFFPVGDLSRFEDELVASLSRNVERGGEPAPWPLRVIGRKAVNTGSDDGYDVPAVRADGIQFFERLDGDRVVIMFRHEGLDPTVATFTTRGAQLLVQATRNKLANASIEPRP